MIHESGLDRGHFKSNNIGFNNLQGGFASDSRKTRGSIDNVNKFIGDIAKNYMQTTEGENWPSDLFNHLNSQFPIEAPKDYMGEKILAHEYGLPNITQRGNWDANLLQIPSLPDLLISPGSRNSNSVLQPENNMNVGYNCYGPSSINTYNPEYLRGSAFEHNTQNVASTTMSFSPVGVKQADLELITSPEQMSSITACSYGDVISDTEAFDSRASAPGSVLHSISGITAENSFQQQSLYQGQFRRSIGKKQTASDMDLRSMLVDDGQSPYSNSFRAQQNFQNNYVAGHILPSSCNTQRLYCGNVLQSQIQMPGPEQLEQWAPQPSVQFDNRLKVQSNLFFMNNEKFCKETTVLGALKMPQRISVALESSSHASSSTVLNMYIIYKSMPADLRSSISFKDIVHSEFCMKQCKCNCPLYCHLAFHFDNCGNLDCNICGPVRQKCGANYIPLESRKRNLDFSKASDLGDPSSTRTLVNALPSKCLKMESSVTVQDGFSKEFTASLNQPLPNLEQWPEAMIRNEDVPKVKTELLSVAEDPMINSSYPEDVTAGNQRKNLDGIFDEMTGLKGSSDTTYDGVKKLPEVSFDRVHTSSEERISDEKEESSQVGTKAGEYMSIDRVHISFEEKISDEKEESSRVGPKAGDSIIEASCYLNSAPEIYESGFESMKSTTPTGFLDHSDLVLESQKPKIEIVSVGDNGSGLESVKIKRQSVSLADLLTAPQIKEHLLSFTTKKDISTNSVGQNTCQLCSMDKLVLAPAPIYCSSCDIRIKRNVGYYRSPDEAATRHCFCVSCFKGSHGPNISLLGVSISKANLLRAKNDEEKEDSWVQCDKCQCWQHRICGLYNDDRDTEGQAEYICPKCCLEEIENGKRIHLPQTAAFGAIDLPSTDLSDHIEQRLCRCLKQEREEMAKMSGIEPDEVPVAEGLVVRVVVSFDKKLEVKQKYIDILHGEDYPTEFSYRSKIIFLFQKIEGVDVCLFGMCVQEFGSECDGPNQRCVYMSYLDSVKYFRPDRASATGESLRTFVYHEILIGYLEHCKKRGFTTCYIWACPLIKGEDYIFYCHPETQKTPKQDKLRQWYKSMLKKGAKDNIVVDHTNLYSQFFESSEEGNTKITAARLPYFDGDYWSMTAENIARKLEQEETASGLKSKLPKRTLKAMGHDNLDVATKDVLVMQNLGQIIQPVKENFMIVKLQYFCTYCHEVMLTGSRWVCYECKSKNIEYCSRCFDAGRHLSWNGTLRCHSGGNNQLFEVAANNVTVDTKDKDGVLVNGFFDTRDTFLNKCQKSHFQFDTLGRAKYSSMMILYHLMRKPVIGPVCTVCRNNVVIEECWHCDICEKLNVCKSCYEMKGGASHTHKLTQPSTKLLLRSKGQQPFQKLSYKTLRNALMHASQCKSISCSSPGCPDIKKLFRHSPKCNVKVRGGCQTCQLIWKLLREHSLICDDSICHIPRCMDLKKFREMQKQKRMKKMEEGGEM